MLAGGGAGFDVYTSPSDRYVAADLMTTSKYSENEVDGWVTVNHTGSPAPTVPSQPMGSHHREQARRRRLLHLRPSRCPGRPGCHPVRIPNSGRLTRPAGGQSVTLSKIRPAKVRPCPKCSDGRPAKV